MKEPLTFYPRHPSNLKTLVIETRRMPILPQEAPFPVEALFQRFLEDLHGTLKIYKDKRFEITGIAVKVGKDIHNKPSIELSGQKGGDCHALCIFPNEDHYRQVAPGDRVTLRANYLVFSNWFGIVMKQSELVSVSKEQTV